MLSEIERFVNWARRRNPEARTHKDYKYDLAQFAAPADSDHVFIYRNRALRKDPVRARIKEAGIRVGVKVYPHRLRHTCATQLLNAGCKVTSIQQFLGHKRLNSTMIYARVHDQTVSDDYYEAMGEVELRMALVPIEATDRKSLSGPPR